MMVYLVLHGLSTGMSMITSQAILKNSQKFQLITTKFVNRKVRNYKNRKYRETLGLETRTHSWRAEMPNQKTQSINLYFTETFSPIY